MPVPAPGCAPLPSPPPPSVYPVCGCSGIMAVPLPCHRLCRGDRAMTPHAVLPPGFSQPSNEQRRVGEGGREEEPKLKTFPSPHSVVWKIIHPPSCLVSCLLFILPISPCYEVLSIKNIKGLFQKYCCDCLHMSPLCLPRESTVVL